MTMTRRWRKIREGRREQMTMEDKILLPPVLVVEIPLLVVVIHAVFFKWAWSLCVPLPKPVEVMRRMRSKRVEKGLPVEGVILRKSTWVLCMNGMWKRRSLHLSSSPPISLAMLIGQIM